jgi:hypothetical protein
MEGKTLDTAAILYTVAGEIEHDLRDHQPKRPASIPSTVTTGVATALLQKAIRRGRTDLALAAAEVLLRLDPDRLWRRCVIVAFEDVGIANTDLIYQTVTAAALRSRLARRFGAWRLVSLIVSRLAVSPKCRAADDLHVAAFDCPAWHHDRLEVAELPMSDLLAVIASDVSFERRAVALRQAISTGIGSRHGRGSRQGAATVFELLFDIAPHTLGIIAHEGYRQTGEIITAFMPLDGFVGQPWGTMPRRRKPWVPCISTAGASRWTTPWPSNGFARRPTGAILPHKEVLVSCMATARALRSTKPRQ